jgi:hypothetical protein
MGLLFILVPASTILVEEEVLDAEATRAFFIDGTRVS